ncbi:MAG TPA: aldo/keto reductase family protein, partial [Actinomycetota bacterium]|nr:aldo/keto reductase family protein [Actinomycetota bacterium]
MEYRRLGASGVRVSEIGLGSWLTYGNGVEADQARACVARAHQLGVNFFDTADVYGRGAAEEVMGQALAGFPRSSYVLATKVYFPVGDGPNDRGLSRKHVMEQCHASLRRLRTDYLDLYQCHRYDDETPLEETLRALDDLVRQGKVHYVGVSEWTAGQIADALALADELGLDRLVANQPEYSILRRRIEAEVLPLSAREGVGQVVWSPLAQGVLTGKYRKGQAPPPDSRAASRRMGAFVGRFLTDEVLDAVERLRVVADEAGLT